MLDRSHVSPALKFGPRENTSMEKLVTAVSCPALAIKRRIVLPSRSECSSPHANWLVPGRVMCGPYPGLDGHNFPTHADAIRNLESLIADSVDTFVCLQSETKRLRAGQHPYFPQYRDYKLDILALNPGRTVRFLQFPVNDGEVPTMKDLAEHVHTLCCAVARGRVLYIHCAGGHGRTGLYASCLLACMAFQSIRSGRDDAKSIMAHVQAAHDSRRAHDVRCKHVPRVASPNTAEQRHMVHQFIRALARTAGGVDKAPANSCTSCDEVTEFDRRPLVRDRRDLAPPPP